MRIIEAEKIAKKWNIKIKKSNWKKKKLKVHNELFINDKYTFFFSLGNMGRINFKINKNHMCSYFNDIFFHLIVNKERIDCFIHGIEITENLISYNWNNKHLL